MQISSASAALPYFRTGSPNDPVAILGEENEKTAAPADVISMMRSGRQAVQVQGPGASFDSIASQFDLTDISPREIDQLGKKLTESGYEPFGDVLMLLTQGAEWKSHLAGVLGGNFTEAQKDQKFDLISAVAAQREMTLRYGGSVETHDRELAFFEEFNDAGKQFRAESSNPVRSVLSNEAMRFILELRDG